MSRDLNELYFEWIMELVFSDKDAPYKKLCTQLDDVHFSSNIPMDMNRADDGTDLRYRFAYENNIDYRLVSDKLDYRPCSVLEMMAALALRCEENIMHDPSKGNRTSKWFHDMLDSMGLLEMTDDNYDPDYVKNALYNMLSRNYKRNGKGGLFTIHSNRCDMRQVEIWNQMCLYMDEILYY